MQAVFTGAVAHHHVSASTPVILEAIRPRAAPEPTSASAALHGSARTSDFTTNFERIRGRSTVNNSSALALRWLPWAAVCG